jgi:glycosyltransferase involved in cell wall biosynthesis/SAM-dependent methyltransferase
MIRQVVIIVPVMVPNDGISGAVRATCDIVDGLEGRSCRILTLNRGIEDDRVRQVGGLMDLLDHPWFLDADVLVYAYGFYNPLFQAMLLGNGKARQVVDFHNVTPEALVPPHVRKDIRKSMRQIHLFSRVDEIWAASRTNIDMLASQGVRTDHARVVPLVVETAERTPPPETPPNTVTILFLGRFVPSKGVLDLLRALETVKAAGRMPFRLVLAGAQIFSDPGYLEQVHAAAARLGDAVDYRGEVTDAEKAELFREADIFAIPSYHEGFCVPVIEALAAGCVPVGYDAHNLPRIFNGFGRLVPTGDVDALAETLEDVCAMLARPGTPRVFELDRGPMTARDRDLALGTYLQTFAVPTIRTILAGSLLRLLALGPPSAAPRALACLALPGAPDPEGIDPMDTSKTPPPVRILLPLDCSDIRDEVDILPDDVMRQTDRPSLNRLPDFCDWEPGNRQTDLLREIGQPICIHRKAWEYGLAMMGLEQLGVVTESAHALAIGAGSEPPIYHYANKIARMVATALYDNPDHEGSPAILENPAAFAPFPYREDHLEVLSMPGDALDFENESFDFAFCLSSIEHFGSRETQRRSLAETARVLKPGGIYCCITELILTRGHTHPEYFTFEEIEDLFFSDNGFELVGGAPDYRISKSLLDYPTTLPSPHQSRSPHIVLEQEGMKWTSFSMFLRKT